MSGSSAAVSPAEVREAMGTARDFPQGQLVRLRSCASGATMSHGGEVVSGEVEFDQAAESARAPCSQPCARCIAHDRAAAAFLGKGLAFAAALAVMIAVSVHILPAALTFVVLSWVYCAVARDWKNRAKQSVCMSRACASGRVARGGESAGEHALDVAQDRAGSCGAHFEPDDADQVKISPGSLSGVVIPFRSKRRRDC